MSVKLLTEHPLEFVSLKGGYTGSSESTLVKIHCVAAQFMIYMYWLRADAYDTLGTFISQRKGKIKTSTTIQVFHACSAPFHARVIEIVFFYFMQTHEKETQLGNYVLCAKSAFVRQATACYPSLKTTTTRGLIVSFFDLKHVREPLPCPFVCC